MATKAKTSAKRGVSKTEIEAEEERKRLAALRAAKRDDDKDEDGDADDDEQRDDDADGDDDKTADDERDGGDDDSSDDERDGGDDDDEEDGKDERAAPAGKRKAVTPAEMRKAAEAAVRADRIRGAKIREIGAQFGYPKLAERHANGETSVRDFKDIVLERLAKRQASRGNSTVAATGTPEIGGQASRGATPNARDFDKGAAEARALLGLK